ncbi:MAG TPA: AAA family ATPase [Chloroflexia bacterium]|nr:AAA family ATPase [Chloroflexia bacterium]
MSNFNHNGVSNLNLTEGNGLTATLAQPANATPLAQLHHLEAELNTVLIERVEAVRAALVALVAGQNIVLLGPPGCGKSLIVTELAKRIRENHPGGNGSTGLTCFTLLMTKYTDPDEVFGPVSLTALKNDERRRTLTHKLPEAHFAFLDEVFKANSAVLNALLTVLNEREFDNGGVARLKLPLISLFGASNEMPEGRELEAFWDRFLLRLVINPVSDAGFQKLVNLLTTPPVTPTAFLGLTDLHSLQAQARQITFSASVRATYLKLRKELGAKGIFASDRRWGQCLLLLQAHALIEGRQTVEEDDLVILDHALWNTPEQRADIKKQIGQLANPAVAKAIEYFDGASNIHQTALAAYKKSANEDEKGRIIVEAVGKLKTVLQNIITSCAPEHRATLETGGRDGIKQVVAALNTASGSRNLNKIENIILQISKLRDELVEHVS